MKSTAAQTNRSQGGTGKDREMMYNCKGYTSYAQDGVQNARGKKEGLG